MKWCKEEGGDPSGPPRPGAKIQSPLVSVAGFVGERQTLFITTIPTPLGC